MQLSQLRYVVQVSKCGSFSEAAKELFISQPSLSQQIIKLEKEFGVKLFERRSNAVVLTDAGRDFVRGAEAVVCAIDNIEADMKKYQQQDKTQLRLGILKGQQRHSSIHKVLNFKLQHPDIDLVLVPQTQEVLLEELLNGQIDCTFLPYSENLERIGELCLRKLPSRYFAVIPLDNPLYEQDEIHLSDLDGQKLLVPAPQSYTFGAILQALSEAQAFPELILRENANSQTADGAIRFISESDPRPDPVFQEAVVPLESLHIPAICFAACSYQMHNTAVRELFTCFAELSNEDALCHNW